MRIPMIACMFASLLFFCATAAGQDLSAPLAQDPDVTVGKLENGLRYYIRYNKKPEKRAELRLAVNAGSVLEEDDQLGLAHFVEHMGFNGTRNFKKQELISYMESIGMRFGPEVSAYTSFDETVYMLTVPTDSASIVEKAFDILEDWAHQMTFDSVETDKERGVVIEEWRLRRGAEMRMLDKQLPVIFKNSRYADRIPIGTKESLEKFAQNRLRQFYAEWYQPDLMAVVAVGDFNKSVIEGLIRRHFSALPTPPTATQRPVYPVPDHDQPLFTIATDPEATSTRVSVLYKRDVEPENTIGDYRHRLVKRLYNGMLNNRLNELTKLPDPPFLVGFSDEGRFVRSKEVYALGAVVKNDGIPRGLDAILTEASRIRSYGFTETEIERERKTTLRNMEEAFNERDKTESVRFATEYVSHFLEEEPFPGIASEYEMTKRFLPTIALEEVNRLASTWITDKNRVVMVNAPDKPDVKVPSVEDLGGVIEAAAKKKVEPYIDKASTQPLVPTPPKPARIVNRKEIKKLGVTEWRLSNGVRVILKPTDFKNDETLFGSFSPGGSSLVPDSNYTAALTASSVVVEGGVGSFDQITLQKMLSGKIVQVTPFIGELAEAISGSCSPADLETALQLIYLYFTSPRVDSAAFASYRTRMRGFIQNRNARPEAAFDDTVQVTLAQHHFRRRPMSDAILDEMNLQKSIAIYRNRFADASDFTFIFVGAFTPAALEPLALTYLGGLPSSNRNETWRDLRIETPKGKIEKTVRKGIEPKSSVRMVYSGRFAWSPQERYEFNSLISLLRIKLREAIREEKGGTYGVSVSGTPSRYPRSEYRISISFGCAPDRVEELTKTAFEQVDSLVRFGTTPDYLKRVKETQRRERETSLKENRFWQSVLQFYYDNKEDPLQLLKYDKQVESLTTAALQKSAKKYFTTENYARFVLYPAAE